MDTREIKYFKVQGEKFLWDGVGGKLRGAAERKKVKRFYLPGPMSLI